MTTVLSFIGFPSNLKQAERTKNKEQRAEKIQNQRAEKIQNQRIKKSKNKKHKKRRKGKEDLFSQLTFAYQSI